MFQTVFAMEQRDQPSFRRFVEDRRYYEAPSRFALHTAYMEVLFFTTFILPTDIDNNNIESFRFRFIAMNMHMMVLLVHNIQIEFRF